MPKSKIRILAEFDRYTKAETDVKVVELSPPATKAHVDLLNIDADLLDGQHASAFATKANFNTQILTTDNWTLNVNYYTLTKNLNGILSTDTPIVDMNLSSAAISNIINLHDAWSRIYRVVTSTNNITFYAWEIPELPENLNITLEVIR